MGALSRGALVTAPLALAIAAPTSALADTSAINAADTPWMMVATALVLMMTIPGLALFYS